MFDVRLFTSALCGVFVLSLLTFATGCEPTKQKVSSTLDGYGVHRNRGYELYRAGDYTAAADSFKKAADRNGADVASHYWWATSLLNLGRFDDAQLPLEQAWAISSEQSEYLPRILDRLGEVYYQQGRVEKLYSFLDEVTTRYHHQSRDYQRQAYYMVKTGDLDGAKTAFIKAANFAGPGDATPYVALADFYESVDQPANAKLVLRYAYAINPEAAEVAGRLRGYGVVLGPAAGLTPPRPLVLP